MGVVATSALDRYCLPDMRSAVAVARRPVAAGVLAGRDTEGSAGRNSQRSHRSILGWECTRAEADWEEAGYSDSGAGCV